MTRGYRDSSRLVDPRRDRADTHVAEYRWNRILFRRATLETYNVFIRACQRRSLESRLRFLFFSLFFLFFFLIESIGTLRRIRLRPPCTGTLVLVSIRERVRYRYAVIKNVDSLRCAPIYVRQVGMQFCWGTNTVTPFLPKCSSKISLL